MDSIGERIKARRKALKMSQAALGVAVGVDQSVISDWENGKGFMADNLMALASALRTTPDYIMRGGGADAQMDAELLGHWRILSTDRKRSLLDVAQTFAQAQMAAQADARKRA